MNGRSPSTVSVAVAKKSRTASKSRTGWRARRPRPAASAARMRRHCAKTRADSAMSMRRAALSSRWLRSSRIAELEAGMITAAVVSTARLFSALFGITRS